MQFDANMPVRRSKPVEARQVGAGEVIVIESAAPPQGSPILREVASPSSPPAIEPTRLGERRRKRGHERRYRLAQWASILSVLGSATAAACMAMGDVRIGLVMAISASGLGLGGVTISATQRLSSRLLGSAIAISVLAILILLAAVGLPRGWFEIR